MDLQCEPDPQRSPSSGECESLTARCGAAPGSPGVERLQAELGSGEGSVRMRLRLLDAAPFITFVYSDSDDGTSRRR